MDYTTTDDLAHLIRRTFNAKPRLDPNARCIIGDALIKIQLRLPKGKFGAWIQANLPFDHIRANQFMRAYRESIGTQPRPQPKARTFVPPQGSPRETSGDVFKDLSVAHAQVAQLQEDLRMLAQTRDENVRLKAENGRQATEIYSLRSQLANRSFDNMFGGGSIQLPKDEYRMLRSCLHPDRTNIDRDRLDKAFRIFSTKIKEAQ